MNDWRQQCSVFKKEDNILLTSVIIFLCIIYLIDLIFVWRCRYQKSGENSRKINVYWDYLHYMMLNWNYKYIVSYNMSNLKEHIYIYIYIYMCVTAKVRNQSDRDLTSQSAIWPKSSSDRDLPSHTAIWRRVESNRDLTTVKVRSDYSQSPIWLVRSRCDWLLREINEIRWVIPI